MRKKSLRDFLYYGKRERLNEACLQNRNVALHFGQTVSAFIKAFACESYLNSSLLTPNS